MVDGVQPAHNAQPRTTRITTAQTQNALVLGVTPFSSRWRPRHAARAGRPYNSPNGRAVTSAPTGSRMSPG